MEVIGLKGIAAIACVSLLLGYGVGSFVTNSNNQVNINDLLSSIDILENRTINNENSIITLQQDLLKTQNDLLEYENLASSLSSETALLSSELDSINNEVNDLMEDIQNVENLDDLAVLNELEALDYRMDRSEAYRLLRKTMSKPGAYIVDSVTDVLFIELEERYPTIGTFEGKIKEIIAKAINSKTPSLVWYGRSCNQINSNRYDTQVVTYFPLELETGIPIVGEIVVARVALVVSGEVNVNQNIVISKSIEVVSISLEE